MVWLRRLLWVVGALVVLSVVAWLAVPPLVKWQAEKHLSELLGRQVTLGSVEFSPWQLKLTVNELSIAAAAGSASPGPQFTLARLAVDADARSLFRLAPVIESLQIEAPKLHFARTADGHYDFDDVLQRLAPKPDSPPGGKPPQFAIYNVELRNGEAVFDDAPVQRKHQLSGLALSLPFLSNLPSQVDIKVEPRLAFSLDGAKFDSGAQAVPFAQSRSGTLNLRVDGMNLEPFLGYVPESLPVRVLRGSVGADVALDFAAPLQGTPSVHLRGKVDASDLQLTERGGQPLLELGRFSLGLDDLQPLERKLAFGAMQVEGMALHLSRDERGAISVQRMMTPPAAAAAPAASAASAPAVASADSPSPAWQTSVASLDLSGSRVFWSDAAVQPASAFVLDDLVVSAQQLRVPADAAMPFSLTATLRPQGEAATTLAKLSLKGQGSEAAATAQFALTEVVLAAAAPYLNTAERAHVAGTGSTSGKVEWKAATAGKPMQVVLGLDQLTLDGLKVDEPVKGKAAYRGDMLSLKQVQLSGVSLDLTSQQIAIASVRLQRPVVRLERAADGQWNLMRLAGPTPLEESARPLVREAAEATWSVRLDKFALDEGEVKFVDAMPGPGQAGRPAATVRLNIDRMQFGLQDLRLRGEKLVSTPSVNISARVANANAAAAPPGSIDWRGRFGLEPLLVAGKLRVERLPVAALQDYAPHSLGVRLASADVGFQGEVSAKQAGASGISVDANGDLLLSDLLLRSLSVADPGAPTDGDRDLLSWQSFAVKGLAVALRPGSVPKVVVREATLSDFFARLVLTEQGKLNLQDIAPHAAAAPDGAASAPPPAKSVAVAASAPPVTEAKVDLPVDLDLGGLRLINGQVDYSDRLIKPSYSAALTALNGSIGAFRSNAGDPATLQLSGRVAGTGQLEVSGRLRPGAMPRDLDVTARATDIELAPLSPYSGKYAGYAIERGKLSVEVHYKIDPDGKLDATHQLVLNQLTFGTKIDSPSATKLPVRLAVSLLQDRNGVIDLNLPISGTLNDPQFSIWPIVWKIIGNVISKAFTAPFSLLSGGSGADLSVVAFQPGTSQPTESGAASLDKVAKALADRPALKMTVVGEADPVAEHDAFQRATIEQQLQQQQRREQLRAAGAASAPAEAPSPLVGEARARAIKDLYRETDLPDKPRNFIGLKADIPPEEMETLLRKNVAVTPEAMRKLALDRGLAVRDALVAKGLPSDRLFLGAPKLDAGAGPAAAGPTVASASASAPAAGGAASAADGEAAGASRVAWTPQVKLTLDTK